MMKKYNQSLKIGRNPNWSYIPDHAYRILIIGGLGSSKTNTLLKLKKKKKINNQILIKFICRTKIYLNQNITCLSTEEKK